MRILVSLPVHENAEVVRGQLRNFLRFLQDPVIILHLSADFEVDPKDLVVSDRVLINPERFSTVWGTGILARIHLSNIRYALTQTECDYVAFHASNDLFVREGVEAYMKDYTAGLSARSPKKSWYWYQRCIGDRPLKRYLRSNGLPTAINSQIEGSFYRRNVFEQMLQSLASLERSVAWPRLTRSFKSTRKRPLFASNPPYPREEVYFPTAFTACGFRQSAPAYVYMNWRRKLNLTIGEVDAVRLGNYAGLPEFEIEPGGELFAVKRVLRDVNDPVRISIDQLNHRAP